MLFSAPVHAQSEDAKVDLVAIFVDSSIYGAIQWDLQRYVSSYIPKQVPGTKSLIFPIDTWGFHAKDIQQILHNLYYDGEQWVPSQLVGTILLGDIPLPIVDLEERRFMSVYPYVDFDDPMFLYNPATDLFMYNNYPNSLPEIRHSTIPSTDVWLFTTFFQKLKEYDASPTAYAKPKLWIEDFPFMKEAYTEEEIDKYINRMLFSEAESYRRVNTPFARILKKEYEEDVTQAVKDTQLQMAQHAAQLPGHESVDGDPEVLAKANKLINESAKVVEQLSADKLSAAIVDVADKPTPTLLLEKTLEEEFDDNQVVFGDRYLSQMQENILAWGRYQLEDIDFASEKIAIRDRVTRQYLEDINTMLEDSIDEQIYDEEYFLKYPLPYLYIIRTPPGWPNSNAVCPTEEDTVLYARYENFYLGRNAVDVLEYPELSITRWSWYNEQSADAILWAPLAARGVDQLEDAPGFDLGSISVGAWYGRHSQQVLQNRAFNYDEVLPDKELYDERKCEEGVDKFSYDFWWWASPMNIDFDRTVNNLKSPRTWPATTEQKFGWHPSVDRRIGWPWYDVGGTIINPEERDVEQLDRYAHHDNGSVLQVAPDIDHCTPRIEMDEMPAYTSYEELDFFDSNGEFFDGWGIYDNQRADDYGYPKYDSPLYPNSIERIYIMVHSPTGMYRDRDEDWKLNYLDDDQDDDGIPDAQDNDPDDDKLTNDVDYDIDNDGPLYMNGNTKRLDFDMDKDGIPNIQDLNMKNGSVINKYSKNVDGDRQFMYKNHRLDNEEDPDIDGDGILNRYDTIDMDGDGDSNLSDDDPDADGLIGIDDPDDDGDRKYDKSDKSSSCWWWCNGSKGIKDTDGDGTLDILDDDQDGDGVMNTLDEDQDGDGLFNREDNDVDADGLGNADDPDDDNDGIPDAQDSSPQWFGTYAYARSSQPDDTRSLLSLLWGTVQAAEDCSWFPADVDLDGTDNIRDPDVDGDSTANHEDDDVDGDGLKNGEDPDIDCDGMPNWEDTDTDGGRCRKRRWSWCRWRWYTK